MSTPQDGGPAFPTHALELHQGLSGMTLRDYACIHLKVPATGVDWLDDIIRKARRDALATAALQGSLSSDAPGYEAASMEDRVAYAYKHADAMIVASEKETKS